MRQLPRFEEIAADLREAIVRGTFTPGEPLPTIDALAEQFHVSRDTVLNALRALRDEGWLDSRRGRGTFVRLRRSRAVRYSPEHPRGTAFADSAAWHLIGVEVTTASPREADWLSIPTGEGIVVRRRTVTCDGRVAQLHISYLPFDLCEGTELADAGIVRGGIYRGLTRVGHSPTRRTEKVTTRMPTREEAAALALGPRTPVLEVIARTFGSALGDHSRVLEALYIVAAGDAAVLMYSDLPVDPARV